MMMMTRWASVLRWLERGLLAAGFALGIWCTAVLIDAARVNSVPPPAAHADLANLPGESDASALAPATGTWVARLEVPSIALSATVLEGTDAGTLRRAAGHIAGTAAPGPDGNIGIAGHRDTIFRPLRNVQIGQRMILTTPREILEYRVASVTIVNPSDVSVLAPRSVPALTLVTCYPFTFLGSAPQRFIVQAELATVVPRP